MARRRWRRFPSLVRSGVRWRPVVALWVAAALLVGFAVHDKLEPPPRWAEGIALGVDGTAADLPVGTTGHFVPGTSIFVPDDASLEPRLAGPDEAVVAESRSWLASGTSPAEFGPYADMAERALLDLRLLTSSDGAVVAAEQRHWQHVWPRDASFAAVAFAVTGHHAEAESILRYLERVHPRGGVWQARYLRDGSGRAPDDRGTQLDASGWVTWATWVWFAKASRQPDGPTAAGQTLRALWPMVASSANAAARAIGPDGVPEPSADYWEIRKDRVTLGTAAPLLLGLRAAADLAQRTGRKADAGRWSRAAKRLQVGIDQTFASNGYPRYVPHGGADTAVTFLAPPLARADTRVRTAVRAADDRLRLPNGGIRPGESWKPDGVAWLPETAMFALAAAGMGDEARARELLDWLDDHRTSVGALPEQVNRYGEPVSVAPLAWTGATVLLTLATLDDDPGTAPPTEPAREGCAAQDAESRANPCALMDS